MARAAATTKSAGREVVGFQGVKYRKDEIHDWRIQGEWWDVCNCDIGCPCEFAVTPTMGFCEGVHGWSIREGHFGDVTFKNLAAVTITRFEGHPLSKNREIGFVIDAKANKKQRRALELIYSGNAGGRFAIWGDMIVRPLGVKFMPINMKYQDDDWFFEIPGKAIARGVPYAGGMVPEGQRCIIINPPRPEAGPGYVTVGQGRELDIDVLGMKFAWPNKSAKHMPFDLWGPTDNRWKKRKPTG